jgi:hypothetical protein
MSTLERVLQLQSQGMQDTDIIRILREENISPLEINNALNQAKVKAAVSGTQEIDSNENQQQFSGMEQSMMDQGDMSINEPVEELTPPAQENYPQQGTGYNYDPGYQQYYTPSSGLDTETISEIAEQIVIEKLEEFTQKTGDLVSFKTSIEEKLRDLNEKVKRIEISLDKIQQAVIGKIGEYGDNLNFIKKDMNNVHETMSKMMNPLIDNYMELKKFNQSKEQKEN